MLHEPAAQDESEDFAADYKSRIGIRLFIVYSVFFFSFVALNTFIPDVMGISVFLGLNLAIIFGFFLIIFAVVLGLIYNVMCTAKERELNK